MLVKVEINSKLITKHSSIWQTANCYIYIGYIFRDKTQSCQSSCVQRHLFLFWGKLHVLQWVMGSFYFIALNCWMSIFHVFQEFDFRKNCYPEIIISFNFSCPQPRLTFHTQKSHSFIKVAINFPNSSKQSVVRYCLSKITKFHLITKRGCLH